MGVKADPHIFLRTLSQGGETGLSGNLTGGLIQPPIKDRLISRMKVVQGTEQRHDDQGTNPLTTIQHHQ